jgi:hypothetical protein
LFEAASTLARLEAPDIGKDHGHKRGGPLGPAWPGDVDLAGTTHAVRVEPGLEGIARFLPTREVGQLIQEVVVLDALQERHHVRMRPDEAIATEDGLQRVPDQRIRPPHELQEAIAGRRRGQPLGDVDEQAAASAMGAGVVICQKDSPSGFMGSVIICWWPTEI